MNFTDIFLWHCKLLIASATEYSTSVCVEKITENTILDMKEGDKKKIIRCDKEDGIHQI